MKVSVIMNWHNGGAFLSEALESLFAQTFKDWELIFLNNNSTDQSKVILDKYKDKRIKYYESGSTLELVKARNLAIEKATHPWLAILDTDDIWSKDKLETFINTITNIKSVDFLFSECSTLNNNTHRSQNISFNQNTILKDVLKLKLRIPWSSVVFSRKLFDSLNGFNEEFPNFHDLDFVIRAANFNTITFIKKDLVICRIHQKSVSQNNRALGKYYPEIFSILNSYPKNFSSLIGLSVTYSRHLLELLLNKNHKLLALELKKFRILEFGYLIIGVLINISRKFSSVI